MISGAKIFKTKIIWLHFSFKTIEVVILPAAGPSSTSWTFLTIGAGAGAGARAGPASAMPWWTTWIIWAGPDAANPD